MDGYFESVIHLDSLPSTVTCRDLLTLIANKISQDTGEQFDVVTVNSVGAIRFPSIIPDVDTRTKFGMYTNHALSDVIQSSDLISLKYYMLTGSNDFVDVGMDVGYGEYAKKDGTTGSRVGSKVSLYANPSKTYVFFFDKSKISTHYFYSVAMMEDNLANAKSTYNVAHSAFIARAIQHDNNKKDIMLINLEYRKFRVTSDIGDYTNYNGWTDINIRSGYYSNTSNYKKLSFVKVFRHKCIAEGIYLLCQGNLKIMDYLNWQNLADANVGYMWKYGLNTSVGKYMLLCNSNNAAAICTLAIKK